MVLAGVSPGVLGDLHGQLEDPLGHRWNVSQHLRDVPSGPTLLATLLRRWPLTLKATRR